jgi:pyruvate-formate lyase
MEHHRMDPHHRAGNTRNRVAADQAALQGRKGHNPLVDAQSRRTSAGLTSQQLIAGRLCHDRLVNLEFEIDDYELLAGRIKQPVLDEAAVADARAYLATIPGPAGQTGHCEVATDELFALGIDGLITRILKRQERAESTDQAEACESFVQALRGLSTMIEHAAQPAEKALATASPERRAELGAIIDSCRHIAHQSPRTFLDALHLAWFVPLGIQVGDNVALVCAGHIDRRLISYYNGDLAAGRLTRERALELLEGLYFLTNDFWPGGVAFAVMVGGRDADGKDVTNELSYLCLEAIRRTNLVYPTVGVCWHEETPEALTDLAAELIAAGHTTPAFFNDQVIQEGLRHYGVPAAEACDYLNSTCVEISTCGSSNIWVASPYFSLCSILLEYIDAVADSITPPATYDDFVAGYFALLGDKIAAAVADQNNCRERRRLYGRKPLQSVFTADCIERARDIDDGGARYNWVECSFVGLANVTDSLKVIREEIFTSQEFDFPRLKELLDSDFDGQEAIRQKFLNLHPKYGLNDPSVDGEIRRLMQYITAECAKHKMQPDDSHFIPGTFCWIMHQRLGAECRATPDGRKAGFAFADGAGPAQGREKLGPTAAIQSVTSWDHTPMIGGSAFNMKFTRALFDDPTGITRLKQLILTFLRQGGFETQINVVDNAMLHKAKANPEAYSDLVVRIGGYTDYFTRLSPEMQEEVLQRTEYGEI